MEFHQKCLICESSNLLKLPSYYEEKGLVKCKDCSFIFMQKKPTLGELEAHYSKYSYERKTCPSPVTLKRYNKLLDEFEPYRNSNRLLDVGCGRGWFLEEAKNRGWEVFGTEFSKTAISLCESKGIQMTPGMLNAKSFQTKDFDVITSFEVIEHLNNPNEEVREIYHLLREGGLFYCTTPNFNSLIRYYLKTNYNVIQYPEHLTYFTKKTLRSLAKKNGFKCLKFLSTGISITRIQASKNKMQVSTMQNLSTDEALRRKIEKEWYLSVVKNHVNKLLTFSNSGLTLKGYFTKGLDIS